MDRRLQELSDLFVDADFEWQLDGATNVSLYHEDYIRSHKDVDLSVPERSLQKFQHHLERKGFALFSRVPEEKAQGGHHSMHHNGEHMKWKLLEERN